MKIDDEDICHEPGCGLEMLWLPEVGFFCRNAKDHELATLRSKLQQHEAELAKAQETIAERDATIKEKDARIAELERVVCTGCWDDARRLATEQQAHAATKEELRKAEEIIQQQARELEEADKALIEAVDWGRRNACGDPVASRALEKPYQAALARHSARAQQESEAKKEESHD